MADPKNETGHEPDTKAEPKAEKQRRFKVLHAAVSGHEPDPKNPGRMKDKDYNAGTIVTNDQLNGQAEQYIILGAIAPHDE